MSPEPAVFTPALEKICTEIVGPDAAAVDRDGAFPARGIKALGDAGILGAVSAPDVGGLALGFRGAAAIVGRLAQECGSTAMVACMHFSGTAVLEAFGSREVRQAAARGSHLSTLAFSEARHIEVFTRRARLKRTKLGRSTIGGQASLKTLVDEPQFAVASFLLSVLGEGTFLSLLWFIEHYAPDPVTATMARLAAQDEARHVAFGLAHLSQHLTREPDFRPRLADAVRRRHDALRHTAGLNDEVFDALLLIAAGSWDHDVLRQGSRRIRQLIHDMDEGRRKRLVRLGFPDDEAAALSALHTRNLM